MSDAKLTACRDWIVAALPTLEDVIILRDPLADAPRPYPTLPYAAIAWLSDVAYSATPTEYTSDEQISPPTNEYRQYRYQRRRRMLHTRLYGGEDIWDLSATLRLSLRRKAARDVLKPAGLKIWPVGEPVDDSDLRSTAWEMQILQDYAVTYVREDTSGIPIIETVNLDFNGEEEQVYP